MYLQSDPIVRAKMKGLTLASSLALIGMLSCGSLSAQDFPAKPVRMIVPFSPGGTSDIVARLISQQLGENLGHSVLVDNRGGAGGTIGTGLVAKSPPDGYTILLGLVSPLAIAVSLYGPKLGYNPITDLAPISMLTKVPQIFTVHPSVPVSNVRDLVALSKGSPGRINYGSGGIGSTNHLVAELFANIARIKFTHVPYKGGGAATLAAISGQVEMVVAAPPVVLPYIRTKRLRGVAASTAIRSPVLPEVPTVMESGYAGFDASAWYAMVAPAGVARQRIDRLHAALVRSLESPDVRKAMLSLGAAPEFSTPEALGKHIRAEIEVWGEVVRVSGAKPE